jgi:hypothetical protein
VNALRLLGKDLRLLRRAPILLIVLVGYPVLVAVLVTLALQGGERKPNVAFVNLDQSGRTVRVGDRFLSIDDYVDRLAEEVNLKRLSSARAMQALEAGQVNAILTIPPGFIADLQTGIRPPVVGLITSRRSPIEADAIERRLQAAIYRLNQNLAATYVDQTLRLVDLVVDGGAISIFGISGEILGLQRSRSILTALQQDLRAGGNGALAARLDPILGFIDATLPNLRLARGAANAIRSPIQLKISEGAPGREPVSAFGFAGALLVSVGLIGVLIAASALSSEREDNVLVRLGRGLVSPVALVGEKIVFAALACVVVGLVLLGAVGAFTSLAIGRWPLWLGTLALSGLGFGAFGVLVGALARETRTALLAGLMLALPLLFLGLVPAGGVAHAIASVVVFGPAFDAFRTLLVEPAVPGDLALTLGRLALITAVFAAAAAVALARRTRA